MAFCPFSQPVAAALSSFKASSRHLPRITPGGFASVCQSQFTNIECSGTHMSCSAKCMQSFLSTAFILQLVKCIHCTMYRWLLKKKSTKKTPESVCVPLNTSRTQSWTVVLSLTWPDVFLSFVKVMLQIKHHHPISFPYLVNPNHSLGWFCGILKGKLSGFYPVVIIIFISAGNYSFFNRELIHMCPLCVIRVHTRGALEVGP